MVSPYNGTVIRVTMTDINRFEVVVDGTSGTPRRHEVDLSPDEYKALTGRTITHEWLLVQVFRFLLEREGAAAIDAAFDVTEVAARYPDFRAEMARRLGR